MVGESAPAGESWRDGLTAHEGWDCAVYASETVAAGRVRALADQASAAWRFLADVLDHRPETAVLILDEHDWPSRSGHPVYGMPNCEENRLFLAAAPSRFWDELVELVRRRAAPGHLNAMAAEYATSSGDLDLGRFFDLTSAHELAHIFFEQSSHMPNFWVEELICNLLTHGFVAQCQPASLPAWTVFPAALASIAPLDGWYRTLADFETHYAYDMEPANYGWYQCRFCVEAAAIYDRSGVAPARRLRDACAELTRAGRIAWADQRPVTTLGEAELLDLLDAADPALGDCARRW
jgi:hypothetical protein